MTFRKASFKIKKHDLIILIEDSYKYNLESVRNKRKTDEWKQMKERMKG